MATLHSDIDTNSDTFIANAQVMQQAVEEFREIERNVITLAKEKAPRFAQKGLLSPRQRLSLLLDAVSHF